MVATYLKCMMMVAAFHHLPSSVLPAIQRVEGGASNLVSNNKNGTQDLGVMQINTRWIVPLMETTHETGQVIYQRLKQDNCYNIAVAGAILKLYLAETNGNLMQAIGNYHSHTPELNNHYQFQIIQASYLNNNFSIRRKKAGKYLSPYQHRLMNVKKRRKFKKKTVKN